MSIRQVFESYDREGKTSWTRYQFCPECGANLENRDVQGKSRQVCTQCKYTYYKNPFPVVSIVILKDGKLLLGKRSADPGKGRWALPSGYIEYEDDFISTAVKEAAEETGLEIKIESILDVFSSFTSPIFHFITVYLLARVVGGDLIAQDDLDDVAWFPVSDPLPELAFEEDHELISRYLEQPWQGIQIDEGTNRRFVV